MRLIAKHPEQPVAAATLVALQLHHPKLISCDVTNIFFIDMSETAAMSQQIALATLLQAELILESVTGYYTLPRNGMQTAWSSKATEIVRDCGFTWVRRIEMCRLYRAYDASDTLVRISDTALLQLHDRLTEQVTYSLPTTQDFFAQLPLQHCEEIPVLAQGINALMAINTRLGLALTPDEMHYLLARYTELGYDPTDAELMMFAQANSEHCRHKIFKADWQIDGVAQLHNLFGMIKHTSAVSQDGILSAYHDNAAIIIGHKAPRLLVLPNHKYDYQIEDIDLVIKVETHNHPTAIAPFPGAATGAGGEIRDEGATGRGAKPKMGLTGFSVSHLQIPQLLQPWEHTPGRPETIASALTIILQAPIGAAAFNNEFGRPNLSGYFRTFEWFDEKYEGGCWRGYHKPIMLAGGLGNIRRQHIKKQQMMAGALIIVLGGPAYLIGLGGSAASSQASGTGCAELDFASVQRSNPEMQRRCQEVIDRCVALGDENPMVTIHDVGAGGLANAIPELLHDSGCGGVFELAAIPVAQSGMSPLAMWCNEAQERYVIALAPENLALFSRIAARENCPFAVVGHATSTTRLQLRQAAALRDPVDIPMPLLFGNTPTLLREAAHHPIARQPMIYAVISLTEAAERVLQFPACASKQFLITIGDRSVGGQVARDQMIGPWQVPVADCAVTCSSYEDYFGEAMAVGERAPVALLNPKAAARLAVAETITNLASAAIATLSDIKLSANWMAASGIKSEEAALYDAVQAIALDFCPQLGLSIPVGKDSLSMQTVWQQDEQKQRVIAPLSLVISGFAPVVDVRRTATPQLVCECETDLIVIDLSNRQNRLGASALAQVYNELGCNPADCDEPDRLKHFFNAIQTLRQANYLLAYHDRSDGGLFITLCEMAFASHRGLNVDLTALGDSPLAILFSEEPGAVIQTPRQYRADVLATLQAFSLLECSYIIGEPSSSDTLNFYYHDRTVLSGTRQHWQQLWQKTSFALQSLRDDPVCALEEYQTLMDAKDPGLSVKLTFDINDDITRHLSTSAPKVAILRAPGVNGHYEMAAAFMRAGFTAIDVHMSDLISGEVKLTDFHGLAACGGFSYGDVLGAGRGWAATILQQPRARETLREFFLRPDTFTLGVCNGCQMLSQIRELIPGTTDWPHFSANRSGQFEARLALVEVMACDTLFFTGMQGSVMPVVVAHGEGQAISNIAEVSAALRYVDHYHQVTERYPANPNGSSQGITGVTNTDGRVLIMMPHPERGFRTVQHSWHPAEWGEDAPWLRLFRNARRWVG